MQNDYYPYLMDYTETNENFGAIGDAKSHLREDGNKLNSMIKAFRQDKDTYVGSIKKLIWANNPRMSNLHNKKRDCWTTLESNGGSCDCRKHSFLRGNTFSKKKELYIAGWEESFCNVLKGYFTKNCEHISGG